VTIGDEKVSNKPVHEVKLGLVKASVWENEKGHSISLNKSYKNESGEWKTTNYFTAFDAPAAARCLEAAIDYVMSAPRKAPQQQESQASNYGARAIEGDDVPL